MGFVVTIFDLHKPDHLKRMILRNTMNKCHCSEVFFNDILDVVKETNRPIMEVANEMGAAKTCTACISDMLSYIQNELEDLTLAGHSTYRS